MDKSEGFSSFLSQSTALFPFILRGLKFINSTYVSFLKTFLNIPLLKRPIRSEKIIYINEALNCSICTNWNVKKWKKIRIIYAIKKKLRTVEGKKRDRKDFGKELECVYTSWVKEIWCEVERKKKGMKKKSIY